eukprot:s342_g18.t1
MGQGRCLDSPRDAGHPSTGVLSIPGVCRRPGGRSVREPGRQNVACHPHHGTLGRLGATYEIVTGGIKVSVDKDRIGKLRTTVQAGLQSPNLVQGVRSLAGEVSWVAGIVPTTIRPFVNMLWAAVYGMDAQQESAKAGASKARARPDGQSSRRPSGHLSNG